ncbi:MAG: DUF1326 domain-containing protein [Gammaproteobacteria bacterium]|nr:DUF1326 domain-containing protein [Gammaproteobacteria bacterium]MDH5226615.1 DUF1326 domain-containing protein [Gammaproteobacteria bacterium]
MAMIDWRLQGQVLSTCNCASGCPCQFMSLPTEGHCRAAVATRITHGHFGSTSLDDICFAGLFAWPGPIHEGGGEVLAVIDEKATADQRHAILTILSGGETDPGATIFNVFSATFARMHEPLFRPVSFTVDVDRREGAFTVPGLIEGGAQPIMNPITGQEVRARIALPDGFEFVEAEVAHGRAHSLDSPIELRWSGRHAHLYDLDMTGHGPVRH